MSRDIDVAEKSAFAKARGDLPSVFGDAQQDCAQELREAEQVCEETRQELQNSQDLLQRAIQEEHRCLEEVHSAEAWVARASKVERPAALAALASANAEYAIAVARTQRMRERVRLATECVRRALEMKEKLNIALNSHMESMSGHIEECSGRMFEAEKRLGSYLSEQIPGVDDMISGYTAVGIAVTGAQHIPGTHDTHLPRSGKWSGDPGDSRWTPNSHEVPSGNRGANPKKKTWRKLMKQYKFSYIDFRNGEPDFTPVSKGKTEIDGMSENRSDNFTRADEEHAKKRGCAPEEVREWRKANGYTWHECADTKTMQKVPTEVHGNVPHKGGISVLKAKRLSEQQ